MYCSTSLGAVLPSLLYCGPLDALARALPWRPWRRRLRWPSVLLALITMWCGSHLYLAHRTLSMSPALRHARMDTAVAGGLRGSRVWAFVWAISGRRRRHVAGDGMVLASLGTLSYSGPRVARVTFTAPRAAGVCVGSLCLMLCYFARPRPADTYAECFLRT